MQCQMCDKQAVVHVTELSGGAVVEQLHLCRNHAETYLQQASAPPAPSSGKAAAATSPAPADIEPAPGDHLRCPVCGVTFREIRKSGRLGCPHDYDFFWPQLEAIVLRVHGEVEHTGKSAPEAHLRSQQRTQLIRLRRELREAVQVEDYERAGEIRDLIRHIEHPLHPPAGPRSGARWPSPRQKQ